MRKVKFFGFLVVLVMSFCSIHKSWAGDTQSYYKNLSITVKNPETAKGRVYLTPCNSADSTYCTISKDPDIAKVSGNLSNNDRNFQVKMFVFPADGYVLDCLCTQNAYTKGAYRSECIGNAKGYPMSSQNLILDSDTTANCTKTRPAKGSHLEPVSSYLFYSVFVPSKKMSVRNKVAGNVASVVNASQYGEAVNDLVVTGPLDKKDLKYLNKLSQDKGLIRLDLSGASFTTVPDSAFYNSGLYELKLPSNIIAVGSYAFARSKGLKPVNLPADIIEGKYTTDGCDLMDMIKKEKNSTKEKNSESNDVWEDLLWYLFL